MRNIGPNNEAAVVGSHVETVTLVKLEFDVPAYIHSGIGTISFGGNDYLGVGDAGRIGPAKESELTAPNALTLELSGINSQYIQEALDAGTFGDPVTIYEGYRLTDGTLTEDPWVLWKGWFESPSVEKGAESSRVNVSCQHDLADIEKKDNSRFTDEDQVERYAGDRFFEKITEMATVEFSWGGRDNIVYGGGGGDDGRTRGSEGGGNGRLRD